MKNNDAQRMLLEISNVFTFFSVSFKYSSGEHRRVFGTFGVSNAANVAQPLPPYICVTLSTDAAHRPTVHCCATHVGSAQHPNEIPTLPLDETTAVEIIVASEMKGPSIRNSS